MLKRAILLLGGLVVLALSAAIVNQLTAVPPRPALGELRQVQRDGLSLHYYVLQGAGPEVFLVASAGRGASDFNELVAELHGAGYTTISVEPRGMLDDAGVDDPGITLYDLAEDIRTIAEAEGSVAHLLIGHAFGNRVVRAYATRYPGSTRAVVLLAAGGKVAIEPRITQALNRSFWTFMPDWWRRGEIELAFFAEGNAVPDYWMGGWSTPTALMQGRSTANVSSGEWWGAGERSMLVIQGMEDRIAPPAHTGDLLQEEFGSRVQVINLYNAGHAILPEQPEIVAAAVLGYIADY